MASYGAPGVSSAFALDQAGGALSYAAVLRVGLWPTTPPLCRYAKCATDLILRAWRALDRQCRHALSSVAGLAPTLTHPICGLAESIVLLYIK
jgi:hypothetical protein